MRTLVLIFISWLISTVSIAQNDIMLQAFYWDVPVDANNTNGTWYDSLAVKVPDIKKSGFSQLWLPPPSKGNWGIYDMGYGIYDHYDLGEYNQIGTVETRFGSYKELRKLLDLLHDTLSGPSIHALADVVLNHMYSYQYKDYEHNPVLEEYFKKEAFINDTFRCPYPANEVVWSILGPNQKKLKFGIKGFDQDNWEKWDGTLVFKIGYSFKQVTDPVYNIEEFHDGDTIVADTKYMLQLPARNTLTYIDFLLPEVSDTLFIQFELFNQKGADLEWTDQNHGVRILPSLDAGFDEQHIKLFTTTGITYVTKKDKPQINWDYSCFHPGFPGDFLYKTMDNDQVRESMKWFGHDLNHYNEKVLDNLSEWGRWLLDSVGFDGFRFDFVNGIDEQFLIDWINIVWQNRDATGPMVGEYFTSKKERLYEWSNLVNLTTNTHPVKVFDFSLKFELNKLCNFTGQQYNMGDLYHAGLLYDSLFRLAPSRLISFVDNHDTGKESDKWIKKDWGMAYAYILFAPMQPCVFYTHMYSGEQIDFGDKKIKLEIPNGLPKEIKNLMFIRNNLLTGDMVQVPVKSENSKNLFLAYRKGVITGDPVILAINNHDTDSIQYNLDIKKEQIGIVENGIFLNALNGQQIHVDNKLIQIKIAPRSAAIFLSNDSFKRLERQGYKLE